MSQSHLELNRHFAPLDRWDETAILHRGEALADRAVAVWPDFTLRESASSESAEEPDEVQEDIAVLVSKVLDQFGGEVERVGHSSRVFYRTADGKVINIKHSKRHPNYYWFGYHASLVAELTPRGVTHVVFMLLPDRYVTLPVAVLRQYLAEAGSSPKADVTVRHYHILISSAGRPELFHHGRLTRTSLDDYLRKFE